MKTGETYIAQMDFTDINVLKGDSILIGKELSNNFFAYINQRTERNSALRVPCRLIDGCVLLEHYEIY